MSVQETFGVETNQWEHGSEFRGLAHWQRSETNENLCGQGSAAPALQVIKVHVWGYDSESFCSQFLMGGGAVLQ